MYQSKKEGGNNYHYYDARMTELAFERIAMKASLYRALDNDEFRVYYQPLIDAGSGNLIGIEALLRWQHPDLGLLFPDRFIHLAEETNLIVEIDRWVMETAMRQMKR